MFYFPFILPSVEVLPFLLGNMGSRSFYCLDADPEHPTPNSLLRGKNRQGDVAQWASPYRPNFEVYYITGGYIIPVRIQVHGPWPNCQDDLEG